MWLNAVIPAADPLSGAVMSHSVPAAGPASVSLPAPPSIVTSMGRTWFVVKVSLPPRPWSRMLLTPAPSAPNDWR